MVVVIPHVNMMEPNVSRFKSSLPHQFDRYCAEERISGHVQKYDIPVVGLLSHFEEKPRSLGLYINDPLNVVIHG